MQLAKCTNLRSLEFAVDSFGSEQSLELVLWILQQIPENIAVLRITFRAQHPDLYSTPDRLSDRLAFATLLASPKFASLQRLYFIFHIMTWRDGPLPPPPMLGELREILSEFDARGILELAFELHRQKARRATGRRRVASVARNEDGADS